MKFYFNIAFILCVAVLSAGLAVAQPYGNEWIVSGQTYYKIPVGKTGMYALSHADLLNAGIPLNTIDPHKLQIWRRGVEQAILVKGQADNSFDNADSLFFYGQINDGKMETSLYLSPAYQPHTYYSLFNDTSAYFLTWTSSGNGKRMPQFSAANTAQAVSPYQIHRDLTLYTTEYDRGQGYSIETFLTQYDQGEGWFGSALPGTSTITLNTSSLYSSGPLPQLEIEFVGRNINGQTVEVSFGSFSDTIFFAGHSVYKISQPVAFADFTGSDLPVKIRILSGLVSLAYIKLDYPQLTDLQGAAAQYIHLFPTAQDTSFLQFSNPPANASVYDITDTDNIRIIGSKMQAGQLQVIVPDMDTTVSRDLYISSSVLSVNSISVSDMSNYASGNYLIVTHKNLMTSAQTYAAYRTSSAGGGNTVVLAEINKLYDLFSYGDKYPIAIRHFADYMLDNSSIPPEYLLILGKGLYASTYNNGVYLRKDPVTFGAQPDAYYLRQQVNLIPPWGSPGSDIMFTMGLNSVLGNYVPAIPTGRVSARYDSEVISYLNKVIEHESLPSNLLWRKNLIHLSGGADAGQIVDFKNFVTQTLKPIAEGPSFGGKVVKTFSKEAPNSVDDSFRASVADEVNKGVSYLTFLGHSSPAVIDVDIGFVSWDIYGYRNKGKYPMLLLNGCSSANPFNYYSFSEDWIITADRGAIAVIGHTDIGYPYQLERYAEDFYDSSFVNTHSMGKPIGQIQQKLLPAFRDAFSAFDAVTQATMTQMILHGDPYVRVYNPLKPDYSINEGGDQQLFVQSYNGKAVTAVSDSFAIGIIVSNFGRASVKDSFAVTVTRVINNKTTVVYGPVMYPAVFYKDTLYVKIKSKDPNTFGENSFTVKVDALDSIPEMREDNNTATLNFFMPLSGVTALLPPEYSIVNNAYMNGPNITLVAQSTDLLITPVDYYFEIDTSYLFNSPVHASAVVNAGSLVKWTTSAINTSKDSLVYYWRVRFDQIPAGQDTLWGESSFIYIGGSPDGWSQSEYPQFTKDNLYHIDLDVPNNHWSFGTVQTKLDIQSQPDMAAPYPGDLTNVVVNGTPQVFNAYGGCGQSGIIAIAFDQNTALTYLPPLGLGNLCGRESQILRSFQATDTYSGAPGYDQATLIDYIDAVPTGDYIMLAANGPAFFSSWDPQLVSKLKSALGSTLVDSLLSGSDYGYIILAKKGVGGTPLFEKYNKAGGPVNLDTTITGTYDSGTITSTLIGPSSLWGSMFRNIETPDASDQYTLKVQRINLDGSIRDVNVIPSFGYSFDLDAFFHTLPDTNLSPYIRLVAELSDTVNLTVPQLDKWQVVYRGVPEGTLDPTATGNLTQYNPFTKEEGEKIPLTFVFENISNIDFSKPVKVKFTITNESGHTLSDTITLVAIQKGQSVSFSYTINSVGFEGKNVFQVFVNPKDQPEQYFDNNILEIAFNIEKDKTNPILDVAFDGQHIMNGDVVSPSPLISINLNDENKFLIKNDSSGMELFLQRPGQTTPVQISMSDPDIVSEGHVAGTGNTYRIEYHPKNLPDGIYTLIVQGTDVSGNKSAAQRYEIRFEVINEVAITYFYPYPNPFSSSTRFVFTLTGNEIPEDMKIQIMTISGIVVREITKSEIGPIHIGNNKTEFAWDGTDEFGDRLANGVYLYRVIMKGAGDFKHKETAGDKAFKKDWGKIYILR